jgi:hypothetical protein
VLHCAELFAPVKSNKQQQQVFVHSITALAQRWGLCAECRLSDACLLIVSVKFTLWSCCCRACCCSDVEPERQIAVGFRTLCVSGAAVNACDLATSAICKNSANEAVSATERSCMDLVHSTQENLRRVRDSRLHSAYQQSA